MPSSIDITSSNGAEYAIDAPMGFRRQRYWFLSFVMRPFQDIDSRALDEATPRQAGARRAH